MAQTQATLTVSEAALEQHMKEKVKPEDWGVINRVYTAGMKVLFDPKTHTQMMQGFVQDLQKGAGHSVGDILGADIAHLMIMLYNESKGTMPLGALIPAGTLLIAKVCEFFVNTKSIPITDKGFTDAVHMMSVAVQHLMSKQPNTQSSAPQVEQAPQQPAGMLAQPGAQ